MTNPSDSHFQSRILVVSPVGGYGGNNTSIHRVDAMRALGFDVKVIDTAQNGSNWSTFRQRVERRLFRMGVNVELHDGSGLQNHLLDIMAGEAWDYLWLEGLLTIDGKLIERLKQVCPSATVVGFSVDDMNARHNQSAQFLNALPYYDVFITTKSYNVAELKWLGCERVLFVDNGFDPATFFPLPLQEADKTEFGADITFIGTYELDRAQTMADLASQGMQIRVWGDGWRSMRKPPECLRLEFRPLFGDDFVKACRASKINLAFLRKANRDLQTSRSVEIPACGGFMLAERTDEHRRLFREDEEACFFGSSDELAEKCEFYLAHEMDRVRIADHGYRRCIESDYSNAARLREAFTLLGENVS